MAQSIFIPADVPINAHAVFEENYTALTKNSDRLALLAGDQKIEHLNKDFYGPSIDESALNPHHLFEIANTGTFGAFATQMGLIARYGKQYPNVNYLIKLNAKTDIAPTNERDPLSTILWTIDDVLAFKETSQLKIRGIGYTVYLGSEHENVMLQQAAQAVFKAHQHGLIATLWMYPRGKYVTNEKDAKLIAGAAGVAACLGADFAKINMPMINDQPNIEALKIAVATAGNTKLICAGGKLINQDAFLKQLHAQLEAGIVGCATGRNVYQRSLPQARALSHAIAALIYEKASLEKALGFLK